jgi:hypothetical protein
MPAAKNERMFGCTAEHIEWHTCTWHVGRARLVCNIMCYYAVDFFFKMYAYTSKEYADIHFVYGFCSGDVTAASETSKRWVPNTG